MSLLNIVNDKVQLFKIFENNLKYRNYLKYLFDHTDVINLV